MFTQVPVDGLIGFTLAPGFTQVAAGTNFGESSDGTYDYAVAKLVSQASLDAAVMQVETSLDNTNTGITFQTPVAIAPNAANVAGESVLWTGTANDGTPVTGTIFVYFDPASGNGVAVLQRWATTPDGSQPLSAESAFMTTSVAMSFTNIP
jgi:hypothetical protein